MDIFTLSDEVVDILRNLADRNILAYAYINDGRLSAFCDHETFIFTAPVSSGPNNGYYSVSLENLKALTKPGVLIVNRSKEPSWRDNRHERAIPIAEKSSYTDGIVHMARTGQTLVPSAPFHESSPWEPGYSVNVLSFRRCHGLWFRRDIKITATDVGQVFIHSDTDSWVFFVDLTPVEYLAQRATLS